MAEQRTTKAADVDAAITALSDAFGEWWQLGERRLDYEDVHGRNAVLVQRKESLGDALGAVDRGALARDVLGLTFLAPRPLAESESELWIALRRSLEKHSSEI